MRFGVHVSIAGGVHQGLLRAVELGCETTQFFLVNPRGWQAKPLSDSDVKLFREVRSNQAKSLFPLVVHLPYLPNLASNDPEIFRKSVSCLQDHLERCDRLGIDYLVIHMGKGYLERMANGIMQAYDNKEFKVCLLMENSAGQGRETCSQLIDFSSIYTILPQNISKGICLDTCHAFAAGYDVGQKSGWVKIVDELEKSIGFREVKIIHLNDSLKPIGSHVDRHARIGEGHIGKEGFRTIFRLRRLQKMPFILEVPRKTDEDDKQQLSLVKQLSSLVRK